MEQLLRNWFVRWHGEGGENQHLLYRCAACHRLVTHNIIHNGGCSCGGSRMHPTNPTLWERVKLFIFPWSV